MKSRAPEKFGAAFSIPWPLLGIHAQRPQEHLPVALARDRCDYFQLLVVFVVSARPRTPGKQLRPIGFCISFTPWLRLRTPAEIFEKY
jgi:hypothetical protein